ncbi:MAG: cyclic pyranopterin monophosphate synthase MoaC [Chthoniobacterales bacterium]
MEEGFSHVAEDGSVKMVDVSRKSSVRRVAVAEGEIRLQPSTIERINSNQIAKGNVLAVARVAAIQAIKRTGELIPLCHSLPIQHAEVDFVDGAAALQIRCQVTTTARTGVEMEALMGVSVAALTIYDMCKAVDKSMVISAIRLVSKTKEPL